MFDCFCFHYYVQDRSSEQFMLEMARLHVPPHQLDIQSGAVYARSMQERGTKYGPFDVRFTQDPEKPFVWEVSCEISFRFTLSQYSEGFNTKSVYQNKSIILRNRLGNINRPWFVFFHTSPNIANSLSDFIESNPKKNTESCTPTLWATYICYMPDCTHTFLWHFSPRKAQNHISDAKNRCTHATQTHTRKLSTIVYTNET